MPHHDLKIHVEHFQNVKSGAKKAEVRKNDRDFQRGDTVLLKEFLPIQDKFTGDQQLIRITDVTKLSTIGIDGFVLFSFEKLADGR